ncbi:MAG: hypothetical protein IKE01_04705 [Clostridia bacterium]|nr:hypothetical protein [Clostridia bacterium]
MEISNEGKMYSEVNGILNLLGDEYRSKLPQKMIKLIESNKLDNYTPVYDFTDLSNTTNISKEAISFICMLHCKYWCESEEEKQEINDILKNNEIKLREKYFGYFNRNNNSETVEIKSDDNVEKIDENKSLTTVNKSRFNFIKKIINFFKRKK